MTALNFGRVMSLPPEKVSLALELQRDWARQDTIGPIVEIVLTDRLQKE